MQPSTLNHCNELLLDVQYRPSLEKTLALGLAHLILPDDNDCLSPVRAIIERDAHSRWFVDLSQPLVISTRIYRDHNKLRAYSLPSPQIHPYRDGEFIGSVAAGGSVNCDAVLVYPHGNGTHTECVGHISSEPLWIADCARTFLAIGQLVSIEPVPVGDSSAITDEQLARLLTDEPISAVIIRTLPNDEEKLHRDWSGTNPPYLTREAAQLLRMRGIEHLLVDLPSLDPESDGGLLQAHKAFWHYPESPRIRATVTELCYIPPAITDGLYLVQLGIVPIESDAVPSQIVLYPAQRVRA